MVAFSKPRVSQSDAMIMIMTMTNATDPPIAALALVFFHHICLAILLEEFRNSDEASFNESDLRSRSSRRSPLSSIRFTLSRMIEVTSCTCFWTPAARLAPPDPICWPILGP